MLNVNLPKTLLHLLCIVVIVTSGILLPAQITHAQEYKVITVVESIVASGLGRSRIIDYTGKGMPASDFTTERVNGKSSKQGSVKRSSARADRFKETKLLNLHGFDGIDMHNIAFNDAIVSAKISELSKEGWSLAFVTSAIESDGGRQDGQGVFITKYVFKR